MSARQQDSKGFVIALAAALLISSQAGQATMNPAYCHVPPLVDSGGAVTPNVMILLDNSGSMDNEAYAGALDNAFSPAREYYGYWEPNRCYEYSSTKFQIGGFTGTDWSCSDPSYPYSGNFLNWAYMTRWEVAKKVLVGGRWIGGSGYVSGEDEERMGDQDYCVDPSPYTDLPSAAGVHIERVGDRVYLESLSSCDPDDQGEAFHGAGNHDQGSDIDGARMRIEMASEPFGVVQDLLGNVRWGLGVFDDDGAYDNGGEVKHYYGFNDNGSSLINEIRTMDADSWTPTAEAMYAMMAYHQQEAPTDVGFENSDWLVNIGSNRDPWWEWEGVRDFVPCRKSYILLVTDGKPTQDLNLPAMLQDFDGDGNDPAPPTPITTWPPDAHPQWLQPDNVAETNGSEYLDDVALWGNTTDMRPDIDGFQNIQTFYVFAFGDTSATGFERSAPWILWNSAINGGFEDKNGNGNPDGPEEWDDDADGSPDNLFFADDGNELEQSIREAVATILKRTSSGTSVSLLTQSHEGEALAVQAYFNPEVSDGDKTVNWLGYTRGLWVDRFFNLREDSNSPGELVLEDDLVVEYRFDATENKTFAYLWQDADPPDGVTESVPPNGWVDRKEITELESLFEAGKLLWERDADDRVIYASLGFSPATPVRLDFEASNAAVLAAPMGLAPPPSTETADVINYIRGRDKTTYRNRTLRIGTQENTWKLGDIMFGTPVVVAAPQNRFDLTYGDETYVEYYEEYKDRRQVVFAAANDGMIHAFNVGSFVNGDRDPDDDVQGEAWIDGDGYDVGSELWGYVPNALLPHLRWLTEQDYCHTYYVDNPLKVEDMQIFADDTLHPNGWGTVLVGSLRLGCKAITTGGTTYRSVVFMLDVTDPLDPDPIYEWTESSGQVGFTTGVPSVVRIQEDPEDRDTACWYLVFGNGPSDYNFDSSNRARLFVRHVGGDNPGCASHTFDVPDFDGTVVDEIVSHPLALDIGLDMKVDAIYFPTMVLRTTSDHDGRLLRLAPGQDQDPDPSNWELSVMFESETPFTTKLAYSTQLDRATGGLWLYIGTGRYYKTADAAIPEQNRFVGLRDDCWTGTCALTWQATDLAELVDCRIDLESFEIDPDCEVDGTSAASFLDVQNDVAARQGWTIEFDRPGERVLSQANYFQGVVSFTSFEPSATAICSEGGGTSRLWFVDDRSGVVYGDTKDLGGGQSQTTGVGNKVIVGGSQGEIRVEANPFGGGRINGTTRLQRPFKLR